MQFPHSCRSQLPHSGPYPVPYCRCRRLPGSQVNALDRQSGYQYEKYQYNICIFVFVTSGCAPERQSCLFWHRCLNIRNTVSDEPLNCSMSNNFTKLIDCTYHFFLIKLFFKIPSKHQQHCTWQQFHACCGRSGGTTAAEGKKIGNFFLADASSPLFYLLHEGCKVA